jgi:NAD(P)-dependent dehydrogenase (short-subunit alcohol dehydrogenase family)
VRRLTQHALAELPRIDVLINNVGGYWHTRHVTADGLERTLRVVGRAAERGFTYDVRGPTKP